MSENPSVLDPRLCNALRRGQAAADQLRCTRPAGWGTNHPGVGNCKLHGGMSPGGVRHGATLIAERDAQRLLSKLGEPQPLANPVRRLRELAGEADQWLAVCREQVTLMNDDFTKLDNFGVEQVRAMVKQYTEAIDRMHRIGADLVRLNLEDRAQRLEESQARQVWEAVGRGLRAGLAELGVPAEGLDVVRRAVGRAARELLPPAPVAGVEGDE